MDAAESYLPPAMPRLFFVLLFLVAGTVHSVSGPTAARVPAGGAFRVVTFNIHKGADNENRYDLERTIAAIASLNPDVIGVQEALRNHPQFACDDQPALIAERLPRLTGQ